MIQKRFSFKTGYITYVILLLLAFTIFSTITIAQEKKEDSTSDTQSPSDEIDFSDLEEVSRRMENPLTSIWSLTLQENLSILKGDFIEGSETASILFFQPFMPFSVGNKKMLVFRPVFPFVSAPVFDGTGFDSRENGFGDIQLFVAYGPDKSTGIVWGVGATFKFPTASSEVLGQGKYQAGPAAMLFYFKRPWSTGLLVQHWTSYAGNDDRADANQTDIQYVIRRTFPGAWSLGMGPTIAIDWEAPDGNKLTFPIGLGVTKTVKWGNTPIKMRFEPQYSIIRPDDLGTEWNIRIQITPVVKPLF
jgi:hypothetical protein